MASSFVGMFFGGVASRSASPVSLTLNELEPRALLSIFLWSPPDAVPLRSTAWSVGDNWQIYNLGTLKFVEQTTLPKLTPGTGDSVEFNGNTPQSNNDCVVDVGNGVTIKEFDIYSTFNKSLILTSPLTVSNGTSGFLSSAATIRGSAVDEPAARGTLNIANNSLFEFPKGSFENVSVNVGGGSMLFVGGPAGTRTITGSDIFVGNTAKLVWSRGNVDVTNPLADSNIHIAAGGIFSVVADGAVWGPTASTAPRYFHIYNHGTVEVDSVGAATLRGDYFTDATTRLKSGTLHIDGRAEQTAGSFELRGGATIKVSGPEGALRIRDGMIAGDGTVSANLTLGYDPSFGPPFPSTPIISPGIFPSRDAAGNRTIGTLTIVDRFQMFNGTMSIDVNQSGAIDQVVVQGAYAALAGSLFIQIDTRYMPTQHVVLPFLTAPSILGDFDQRTLNDYRLSIPPANPFGNVHWGFSRTATSYNLRSIES